jgi:hypothetical protein
MAKVNDTGQPAARCDRAIGWMIGGLALAAALFLAGCVSTSSDDGSSSASCDGTCADVYTGYGIIETIRILYNTHVYPGTGSFNETQSCSLGGQVVITGSVGVAGNATTLDLLYTMTSCAYSDGSTFDLVFTGGIDEDGNINNIDDITTLQYISSSLTISGEAYGDAVSETCAVNISRSDTGVTGTICGRSFSY